MTESDRSGREDADDDRRAGRGWGRPKWWVRAWASKVIETVAGVARGRGGERGEGAEGRGERGGKGREDSEGGDFEMDSPLVGRLVGRVGMGREERKRSTRLKAATSE